MSGQVFIDYGKDEAVMGFRLDAMEFRTRVLQRAVCAAAANYDGVQTPMNGLGVWAILDGTSRTPLVCSAPLTVLVFVSRWPQDDTAQAKRARCLFQ